MPSKRSYFGFSLALVLLALRSSMGLQAAGAFQVSWTNNILTATHADLPGGRLEILYLEAFLRPGASQRPWGETKIPHRTELLRAGPSDAMLAFRTTVEADVEVLHEVRAGADHLDLTFEFRNRGAAASDIQWFQPACIRTAGFTGRNQSNYIFRSFVFTPHGLSTLDSLGRTTNALYLGGQVYLPPWTLPADANPRPLCHDRLSNGLIGCYSADNRWILATASDRTHELFEGVYVCLHSDPLISGLKPGETKRVRQKIYLLPNDAGRLLQRYQADFPDSTKGKLW